MVILDFNYWQSFVNGSYFKALRLSESLCTRLWWPSDEIMTKDKVRERSPCPYLENIPFVFVNNDNPPQSFGFNGPFNLLKSPQWVVFLFVFSLSGVLFLKVLRLICLRFFFLFAYDSFPYCLVRFWRVWLSFEIDARLGWKWCSSSYLFISFHHYI